MEARIVLLGEKGNMGKLANSVNSFIDISDAFVREAKASMEHASDNKFYRKVLLEGLQGSFC